jgi:hypothetical protein
LNKNYTISRIFLDGDSKITAVEFRLAFTLDEYPGFASVHQATQSVPETLSADATDEEIIDLLQPELMPIIGQLELYHGNQIMWQHKLATSTVVQKEEQPVAYEPLWPVDFKLGMMRLNVTPDMVDAAISQLDEPDRTIAQIYWTSANQFMRDNPLIDQIAGAFGKTAAEVDAVWLQAQDNAKQSANLSA